MRNVVRHVWVVIFTEIVHASLYVQHWWSSNLSRSVMFDWSDSHVNTSHQASRTTTSKTSVISLAQESPRLNPQWSSKGQDSSSSVLSAGTAAQIEHAAHPVNEPLSLLFRHKYRWQTEVPPGLAGYDVPDRQLLRTNLQSITYVMTAMRSPCL